MVRMLLWHSRTDQYNMVAHHENFLCNSYMWPCTRKPGICRSKWFWDTGQKPCWRFTPAKMLFCPKVFCDAYGARLCTLELQNIHTRAARTLYIQTCRPSLRVRVAIIQRNIRDRVRFSGPRAGDFQLHISEREWTGLAFIRLFHSSWTALKRRRHPRRPRDCSTLASKTTPPSGWTFMTAKPPRIRHSYSEEDKFMGMNSYVHVRIAVTTYINSIVPTTQRTSIDIR